MDAQPDIVLIAKAEWDLWICQNCALGAHAAGPSPSFHDEESAHEHLREHKRAGQRMPHGYRDVWPDVY